jgi:hypothetical protein
VVARVQFRSEGVEGDEISGLYASSGRLPGCGGER